MRSSISPSGASSGIVESRVWARYYCVSDAEPGHASARALGHISLVGPAAAVRESTLRYLTTKSTVKDAHQGDGEHVARARQALDAVSLSLLDAQVDVDSESLDRSARMNSHPVPHVLSC